MFKRLQQRLNKRIKRIVLKLKEASRYSWKGLRAAYRYELAFRLECALSLVIIPLGAYLGKTRLEKVALLCSWLLVLVVELLNSAIESTVNRIGSERHVLSGRAKDMGSAAVFVSCLLAGITWAILLL